MKIFCVSLVLLGGVFVAGSGTASDPSRNYAVMPVSGFIEFTQQNSQLA